jgi:hypothetical protein
MARSTFNHGVDKHYETQKSLQAPRCKCHSVATFVDKRRLIIRRIAARIPENAGNNMDDDLMSPSSSSTFTSFTLVDPKGS